MAVDVPMLALTILMMFFIPGYTLVQALFPGKRELHEREDGLHRFILSIGMSMAIFVFVGFSLSSLGTDPDTGKGYFQPPYILTALAALSVAFFIVGLARGAYPRLAFSKERPIEYSLGPKQRAELIDVLREWKQLSQKLEDVETAKDVMSNERRGSLKQREESILKRMKSLERRLLSTGVKDIDRGDRSSRLQALIHEWRGLRTKALAVKRKVDTAAGARKAHHRRELDEIEERLKDLDDEIEQLRDEIT